MKYYFSKGDNDMNNKKRLYILWSNQDPVTTEKMVFMYALNSKLRKWWDEVTIIVWGGTAKLITENKQIQVKIKELIQGGVEFSACKACAEQLEAVEIMEKLGIEVKYWGQPLTDIIQSGEKLITV